MFFLFVASAIKLAFKKTIPILISTDEHQNLKTFVTLILENPLWKLLLSPNIYLKDVYEIFACRTIL